MRDIDENFRLLIPVPGSGLPVPVSGGKVVGMDQIPVGKLQGPRPGQFLTGMWSAPISFADQIGPKPAPEAQPR